MSEGNSAGLVSKMLGDSPGIFGQLSTQGLFKEQGGIGLFSNPSGKKVEAFFAEIAEAFQRAGGSGGVSADSAEAPARSGGGEGFSMEF